MEARGSGGHKKEEWACFAVMRAGGVMEGRGVGGQGAIARQEIVSGVGDALREEDPNDCGGT